MLSLVTVLFMCCVLCIRVEATNNGPVDGSGDSADQSAATGKYAGGPSYSKTGWLIYILDEDSGARVSPSTVFYDCGQAPPDMLSTLKARIPAGGSPTEYKGTIPDYIGRPFDNGNIANGMKIKSKLIGEGKKGGSLVYDFIEDIWGTDISISLDEKYEQWVLIMEPVYWYNLFVGGINTGKPVIGTAYQIGQWQSAISFLQPKGDRVIGSMTNGIFATCAMVEPNAKFGIQSPTNIGRVTNNEMVTYGYGMIQVWPTYNTTHTWDQAGCGSVPGPAPEKPIGTANIVKSYHTINKTTGTDTHDGCFIRRNTSTNILIEDEPEYKVQKWKDARQMAYA